jgi:hypothetical protein
VKFQNLLSLFFSMVLLAMASNVRAQALYVTPSGDVGIGTDTPESLLTVEADLPDYPQLFLLENLGSNFAGFRFETLEGAIDFNKAGGNTFRLNVVDGDGWEFEVDPDGNLTIKGEIVTAGSCSSGCDIVFSENYRVPSIEEHAAEMWRNSYLPEVGPTIEGQPFNLTHKTQSMLNELEKAHIYIDKLNSELKQKETKIAELDERLARLEALVN